MIIHQVFLCKNNIIKMTKENISIKTMAERAKNKDEIASKIFSNMGDTLGKFKKKFY